MRILAIETSGQQGSLAILAGDSPAAQTIGHVELAANLRTAQVLAPALRDLLRQMNWPPSSIGLVAVAVGPGSFTGLRIGVTTAKAFAYAVGAEIIGVNTLEALALQTLLPTARDSSPLWTILDAQRQELFVAKFAADDRGEYTAQLDASIISQDAWLAGLQPGDRVTGPALRRLVPRLPAGVQPALEELWQPTAMAVGKRAWKQYLGGKRDDVWKLSPAYFRPSAAEERAASRIHGKSN